MWHVRARREVHTVFWCEHLTERYNLEDSSVDGRIIFKWISKKWDDGGPLYQRGWGLGQASRSRTRYSAFRLHKMRGISWEALSFSRTSPHGFGSLVSYIYNFIQSSTRSTNPTLLPHVQLVHTISAAPFNGINRDGHNPVNTNRITQSWSGSLRKKTQKENGTTWLAITCQQPGILQPSSFSRNHPNKRAMLCFASSTSGETPPTKRERCEFLPQL